MQKNLVFRMTDPAIDPIGNFIENNLDILAEDTNEAREAFRELLESIVAETAPQTETQTTEMSETAATGIQEITLEGLQDVWEGWKSKQGWK